jgi:hypothetical protein
LIQLILTFLPFYDQFLSTYHNNLQHLITVVQLRGVGAGNITEELIVQLGATFQETIAVANGLNIKFCDPFFRVVNSVQVLKVEQTTNRKRRQLQQEQASSLPLSSPSSNFTLTPTFAPSSSPAPTITAQPTVSAAPSSRPTISAPPTSSAAPSVGPTISAQPTVSVAPSSGLSISAQLTVSAAPSSGPTMYPTPESIFSFLFTIMGDCRGCGSDGLNSFFLDPNTANQVSGRRLEQDVYEIDPSKGILTERRLKGKSKGMLTKRRLKGKKKKSGKKSWMPNLDADPSLPPAPRLQDDQQDDCVCVVGTERRGPTVSLHCILLLDCADDAVLREITGLNRLQCILYILYICTFLYYRKGILSRF